MHPSVVIGEQDMMRGRGADGRVGDRRGRRPIIATAHATRHMRRSKRAMMHCIFVNGYASRVRDLQELWGGGDG